MPNISGTVLFCEDFREELRNKISYIGTLGSVLYISNLPATASALAFAILVRVHEDVPQLPVRIQLAFEGSDVPAPAWEDMVLQRDEREVGREWVTRIHGHLRGLPLSDGMLIRVTCEVIDGPTFGGELLILSTTDAYISR